MSTSEQKMDVVSSEEIANEFVKLLMERCGDNLHLLYDEEFNKTILREVLDKYGVEYTE